LDRLPQKKISDNHEKLEAKGMLHTFPCGMMLWIEGLRGKGLWLIFDVFAWGCICVLSAGSFGELDDLWCLLSK
jgi:hypothetical protein